MRKEKQQLDKHDEICGVNGETTVAIKYFERFDWKVLITKTLNDSYGESYFNVYILDYDFVIEPLNNLDENIPLENEPKDWNEYLLKRLCERYIWKHLNYNISIDYLEDNEVQ